MVRCDVTLGCCLFCVSRMGFCWFSLRAAYGQLTGSLRAAYGQPSGSLRAGYGQATFIVRRRFVFLRGGGVGVFLWCFIFGKCFGGFVENV